MELVLHFHEQDYENCSIDKFIKVKVLSSLKSTVNRLLDTNQLIRFDNYINNKLNYLKMYPNKMVSTKSLILECIANLVINKYNNTYIIKFNFNKNASNLKAKLLYIAKLIDCGNLELQAYPIFTRAFNEVYNNISKLLKEFKEEN